jgi:undecaprenyl-diphosphatase
VTLTRAVWGYIDNRDRRVMRRMQRWRAPRWIRFWMIYATRLGDGWVWYSLGLMLLAFGGSNRFAALGSGGLAAVASIFLFRGLKNMSRRKRPCQIEPHCWAKILPPDQFSFPSGHSITAFAIAVAVGAFYPHLQAPLYFLATSIAISRVVLGMHFLSDIVAGSAFGALLGYGSVPLFR